LLLALLTLANFKIGHTLFIDVSRQQQLPGVITQESPVRELDDREADIEEVEGCFLALAFQDMSHDIDRLSLPFRPQIFQRALRRGRTSKASA